MNGEEIVYIKKGILRKSDIDECRLHARKYINDAAHVDAACPLRLKRILRIILNKATIL
ncbi:hypothetical protein D3C86_2228020 [compost metagenome]